MVLFSHMAESDVQRLSRLVLGEFKRVHDRFDLIDGRFDTLEPQVTSLETELRGIHKQLDALSEGLENATGYAKEIDHILKRVVAIEKHLGLQTHIKA